MKALKNEGESYFVQPVATEEDLGSGGDISPEASRLLEEFDDLFHTPMELPPPSEQDRAINLKEGAEILHIR